MAASFALAEDVLFGSPSRDAAPEPSSPMPLAEEVLGLSPPAAEPQPDPVAVTEPDPTLDNRPRDPGGIIPETEEPSIRGFVQAMRVRGGKGFMNIGQGFKQVGLEALEAAGHLEEGVAEQYTKLTQAQRQEFDRAFESQFGEAFFWDALEFTAETAPSMVVGGVVAKAPKVAEKLANLGFRARTALQTGIAAAEGGTTFVDEGDSRGAQTLISGVIGGGAGAVIERISAMKNYVSNTLRQVLKGSRKSAVTGSKPWRALNDVEQDALVRARADVAEGLELFDKVEEITGRRIPFTIASLTDDPEAMRRFIISQEGVKGQRAFAETSRQQLEAASQLWDNVINRIEPGTERVGDAVRTAFDRVMGDPRSGRGLLGARDAQAAKDFTKVRLLAKDVRLGVGNLRAAITKIRDQNVGALGKGPQRVVREMDALLKQLGDRQALPLEDFQKTLSAFGNAATGSARTLSDKVDPVQSRTISKFLFKAMSQDLDAPLASGLEGLNAIRRKQVVNALKQARSNYRDATDAIRKVNLSALGKVFNVKPGVEVTTDAIEGALMRMGADDTKVAINLLEQADPAMASRMRGFWLTAKFNEAQQAGKFTSVEFSPGRMFDLLRQDAKFEAMFPKGSVDRDLVDTAFDFMRRTVGQAQFSAPSGALPRLKEFAGLAAGSATGQGSPIFWGRALGGMLFSSRIWPSEEVLTSQGIRAALARSPSGPAVATAAGAGSAGAEVEQQEPAAQAQRIAEPAVNAVAGAARRVAEEF